MNNTIRRQNRQSRIKGCLLPLIFLVLVQGISLEVKGQESTAEVLVSEASALFNSGDFEAAAEMFQSAFEMDAHPAILYNWGRCKEEMGQVLDALELYYRATDLSPQDDVFEAVVTKINEIESLLIDQGVQLGDAPREVMLNLGELDLTTLPTGADVYIDEQFIGHSPLRQLYLSPGRHVVRVTSEGFQGEQRTLNIEPRAVSSLHVGLRMAEGLGDYVPPEPGRLSVSGPEPGMTVYLDDELFGVTPVNQVLVSPGRYSIRVSHPDYIDWHDQLRVLPGETNTVFAGVIELANTADTGRERRDRWILGTGVSGGVLMAVGTVFGVLAKADADRYNRNIYFSGRAEVRQAAMREAAIADLNLLLGIGLVTASLLLFFLEDDGESNTGGITPAVSFDDNGRGHWGVSWGGVF